MLKVPPGESIAVADLFPNADDPEDPSAGSSKQNQENEMPQNGSLLVSDNFAEIENIDDPDEDGFAVITPKKEPEKGDYVVVKFTRKKILKHFIGCVLEVQEDGFYDIKYMRKRRANVFVFPIIDDIALAFAGDIEIILNMPKIRRDIYEFNDDLTDYKL